MIKKIPPKYKKIWFLCQPYFKQGRPGDKEHAEEVINFILSYKGKIQFDKDILIPLAMMHDIGHAAILPEHFIHITGPKKIINGKMVHMLAGAKIAQEVLKKAKYDKNKSKEIVESVSIHDMDQIKGVDIQKIYNTKHKKLFHDFDSLDRYNEKRMKSFLKMFESGDKNKWAKIFKALEDFLELYFYNDIKQIAEDRLTELKNKYSK